MAEARPVHLCDSAMADRPALELGAMNNFMSATGAKRTFKSLALRISRATDKNAFSRDKPLAWQNSAPQC